MRWLFFGAGNMASSLIGGLLANGCEPSDVRAIDIDVATRHRAESRFGIETFESLGECVEFLQRSEQGSGLVIAVKPQYVAQVCRSVNDDLGGTPDALPLVVSVAAGIRIDSMESWLPRDTPIVRVMPNTPALLGEGASGLCANAVCDDAARNRALSLFEAVGRCWWVENESQLDAVTAVAGSGPAYFFFLIEHLSRVGTELGLDRDTARALAIQTAHGAAAMARADGAEEPAVLRRNVTSPGGTTAAAIASFEADGFPDMIDKALRAAFHRSMELADEFGNA